MLASRIRGVALELRARGWRRAWPRLVRILRPEPRLSYDEWVTRCDTIGPADVAAIERMIASMPAHPRIAALVYDVRDPVAVAATRDSLQRQLYRPSHVDETMESADPPSALSAPVDFVALVAAGDTLAPDALAVVAAVAARSRPFGLLYSDEDIRGVDGRRRQPYFKTDWNRELGRHQDYACRLAVLPAAMLEDRPLPRTRAEVRALVDSAGEGGEVVHVPHVLYHRAAVPPSALIQPAAADRDDAPWPKVSVIVPTRDHADVLETCLNGLFEVTDYPALEVIVADNGSVEPATTALFETMRRRGVVVVDAAGPFNFSRINNRAATAATGDVLLFLNNDVSMVDAGWLKAMVLPLAASDVGAAGAKLLYPDGTVQHAGVVLGMLGVAGHAYVGAAADAPGPGDRLRLAQDVSCVTAAAMVVKRDVFEAVGGFDEDNLAVAFNDVDLCIRIREAGYRIIWTPEACLIHHESKSRGDDRGGAKLRRFQREIAYMQRRWGPLLDADPYWSPNLSLAATSPQPAVPPRRPPPWWSYRPRRLRFLHWT